MTFRGKGTPKLMPKYVGPYKIEKKTGPVAYRLALLAKSRVHPTFHVSLLKPYKGAVEDIEEQGTPLLLLWLAMINYLSLRRLLTTKKRRRQVGILQ